jgi:hypothetical protein
MAKSIRKKKSLAPLNESRGTRDEGRSLVSPPSSIVHRAFSGWPMIFGWLAMLIFTFHACTHMVAAGDTWFAMACGRHFVNHGVDTVEPFSANSHKAGPTEEEVKTWPGWAQWLVNVVGIETVKKWHPTGWINQNWLTHVIFYLLVPKSSYEDGLNFTSNALVYWKFAIYVVTIVCVYYTGRLLGVNPALSAVFSCFALFEGRSFLDIRPAGFSNMLVAVFLLILVLTTYRNILYIWLIVPVTVFWCNVHGGYIYVFIMLVPFVALNLLTCISKKRFVSIGLKGIYHTIAAGIVTFVAVILFNPFHLTNLTHTFIISVSKHAERWRDIHEWHPAFDWTNPVGTAVPFLVMYIMAVVCLLLLIAALMFISFSVLPNRKRNINVTAEYQLPKIDLALMVIAALTIYMAIRSRRFIPIAGIAACPIIAMFIDQIICAILAVNNFKRSSRLTVPDMPKNMQLFFTILGAGAVIYFGTWWGLKFKRIYLAPWPGDPKLTSVFMRMTASDAKPFYACKFIKTNKLKGKMFNYWTEGGFIAWAQEPDPNTGKTPLQLFMDGRAQAAYDRKAFDVWTVIMSGGPAVREAQLRKRSLTADDYTEIGRWVGEQLKSRDVWVVLMPSNQFDTSFMKGLEHNPNWRSIFFNDTQNLLVDITTPQGKELFEGVFGGKTLYPDEFSENLIKAHLCFTFAQGENVRQKGLDFTFKAFNLNPSPASMFEIVVTASRFPELKPHIEDFCKNYVDQFIKHKDEWAKQHGYQYRIEAARIASMYLLNLAKKQKNDQLVKFYDEQMSKCSDERFKLFQNTRW